MDINLIIGTWELSSCVTIDDEGYHADFFGSHPKGVLMYDKVGNMAAQFMPQKRVSFKSSDWSKVTPQEAQDALMSYQAYYGKYKMNTDKKTVTHFVSGGIRPNWKGLEEIRFYEFKENSLILKSPPILVGGKKLVFQAIWNKAIS